MTDLFDLKKISKITGIALLIYLLSFLGYIFPFLNYLFFVAIFVVALYFTLKKLEYGVFILLLELIIGVKGYLFSVGTGNFVLSLRIALFAMVFLVWFIKKRPGKFKFFGSKFFPLYALFTVMILLGVIIALANGYSLKNIFFDVNGYFYLALIFILFTAIRKKEQLNKTLQVVIAGGLAISMLTFYCIAEFTIFTKNPVPIWPKLSLRKKPLRMKK